MERDRLSYNALLARLADAAELVRSLSASEGNGGIPHSMGPQRLAEAGKALHDVQRTLRELQTERTHKPDFSSETPQAKPAGPDLVAEVLPYGVEWAFAVLDSIQDAVILTDAAGKIIFMNQCAQDLTAWPLAEARGKDLDAILHFVNEAARTAIERTAAKLLRAGTSSRTRALFVKDDSAEVPLEYYGRAIHTRDSQIAGLVLVLCDISQQQLMEQALRNSERLIITGRLAATVAHEIRNPLEAIGNLLYLIAQGTKGEQTQDYVSLASQELERVAQIARHFLTFQRESAHPVPIRMEEIIDNVLALYARKISSAGITIEKEILFDGSLLAHPGEMRQVVANLVGNSIDAVPRGHSRIQIRVYSSHHWRSGRAGMRFVLADNGPGIPAEIRDKVFEPFFTTKGERGTGLGLWISRGIINKYEGAIRLRSSTRPGRSGTCFSVFLPI